MVIYLVRCRSRFLSLKGEGFSDGTFCLIFSLLSTEGSARPRVVNIQLPCFIYFCHENPLSLRLPYVSLIFNPLFPSTDIQLNLVSSRARTKSSQADSGHRHRFSPPRHLQGKARQGRPGKLKSQNTILRNLPQSSPYAYLTILAFSLSPFLLLSLPYSHQRPSKTGRDL